MGDRLAAGKGLLEWADEIGPAKVLARLEALRDHYGEERYRPSPILKRIVSEGGAFY